MFPKQVFMKKNDAEAQNRQIWIIQHPMSRYGVAQVMSHEIADGLSKTSHHIDAEVFTRGTDRYLEKMAELDQDETDVLCRFVVNQTIPDDLVYEFYGIPHVSYLLDAVSHSAELLVISPFHRSIATFVDGDSSMLYERITKKQAHWIPHAIDPDKIERKLKEQGVWDIPYEKRPIDIVISGSWIDRQQEEDFWKKNLKTESFHKLITIAEQVLQPETEHNHLPFLYELITHDEVFRNDLEAAFSYNIYEAYISLEKYIRGRDRERMLSLLDGFNGHVTLLTHADDAEKWKKSISKSVQLTVVEDVPYEETWRYYAQAKVVVNSVPTIKKGVHERLLAALFCSAKVLTTYSSMLPQESSWTIACPLLSAIDNSKELTAILCTPYGNAEDVVRPWINENHSWQARFEKMWPPLEREIRVIQEKRAKIHM